MRIGARHAVNSTITRLGNQNVRVLTARLSSGTISFHRVSCAHPAYVLVKRRGANVARRTLTLTSRSVVVPVVNVIRSLGISITSTLVLCRTRHRQRGTNVCLHRGDVLPRTRRRHLLFRNNCPILTGITGHGNLPCPRIGRRNRVRTSTS